MRKDDSADVSALHDYPSRRAHFLLQAYHPDAYRREDAYPGGGVGHYLVADESSYVFAVEQDAVFVFAGLQADGGFGGKIFQSLTLVQGHCEAESFQGKGAVHGSCLKIQEAEIPGQMAGNSALASSGRSVNGDNRIWFET